jgi:hypothetical protein
MPLNILSPFVEQGGKLVNDRDQVEQLQGPLVEVAIFNVKFSPNFGDGLLAICLERALEAAAPILRANSIDLAGRCAFAKGNAYRGLIMSLMEVMPSPLRRIAARIALEFLAGWRFKPFYRKALGHCKVVVIGGGNLFADADLNFPIKVAGALTEATRRALPVAVYGVGVTSNWSRTGHRLFSESLRKANLVDASARDERSRRAWNDLLCPNGIRDAGLAFDPGLLARKYFEPNPRPAGGGLTVALGITDPRAIRYHGGPSDVANYLADWYGNIAAALASAGYEVVLFTNGSTEDKAYLGRHGEAWRARMPDRIGICADFDDPAGMVGFLAASNLVIAHRMHACIAAYSFAIPTIGLRWDIKLDSFFRLTGRLRYIIDPADVDPCSLVELAREALAEGVDPMLHQDLLDRCQADVARLADVLVEAASCPAPTPRDAGRTGDQLPGRIAP